MDPIDKRQAGGFTLIELMVTLGIGAILLAIGAPSVISTVMRYRLADAHSAMRDALMLARDTARNETATITVCASSSGTSCTNTSWQLGYIVFRDGGTAGTVDSGDTIIARAKESPSGISISATVKSTGLGYSRTYVQFGDDGKLDPYYALEFTSCAAGQLPYIINVQRGGFISTLRGSSTCS